MLECALKFQKAFKRLGEKSANYVLLSGGPPNNEDWDNAKYFLKFLKLFYDMTKKVSGSAFVTSSLYFLEHCSIMETFRKSIGDSDRLLKGMAEKMKVKYDKYWGNVKNMNMLIFVVVVFDPRQKFKFLNWGFKRIYEKDVAESLCEKVKEILYKMFDSYRLFLNEGQAENSIQEMQSSELGATVDEIALEFEKDMSLDENMNKNEVDLHLMEALEKKSNDFDLLNWWKVNSTKYPILGHIARDILAMPVSTVASESAFSTGGRILSCYRSSLSPKTVEALICTQNWCRSSPLSVDIEEMLEDLENLEEELVPLPQLTEEVSDIESD